MKGIRSIYKCAGHKGEMLDKLNPLTAGAAYIRVFIFN